VLLTAVAALFVCLIATIYPARAASRVRPAEALRYE
jgi:lipoprotein-releasing system permease protein